MKRIMCLLPIIMLTSCSLGNKEGNSGTSSFIEPLDSLTRSDSILETSMEMEKKNTHGMLAKVMNGQ